MSIKPSDIIQKKAEKIYLDKWVLPANTYTPGSYDSESRWLALMEFLDNNIKQ